MKTYTFTHNGFHGSHEVSIRPLSVRLVTHNEFGDAFADPVTVAVVSPATAKRVSRHLCGMTGCCCGEGISEEIWIPSSGNIRGNYPQS